jgi:hypothetical protein
LQGGLYPAEEAQAGEGEEVFVRWRGSAARRASVGLMPVRAISSEIVSALAGS